MVFLTLALVLGAGPGTEPAADSVTLRDGSTVLGQLIEPSPRGKVNLVVRRSWAEKALPAKLKAWEAAETPTTRRAVMERLRRLEAWSRDRAASPIAEDEIARWLPEEIRRVKDSQEKPPLMVVSLNRADVRHMTRRPADVARMLRQGWRAKFDDAETKPLEALKSALEGRGFALTDVDPAPIDAMLPIPIETEPHWRARRAATEVAHEPGLKFLRTRGLLLPESANGGGIDGAALGKIMNNLLNDGPAEDPLSEKGREIAARGRVGMLVTRLDTAEDLSGVSVNITLYARISADRWEPAASRSVQVKADEAALADAGNIAADPQVSAVFKTVEGLGLAVPDSLKQKSLAVGSATQKALGGARTAIQPDLDSLEISLAEPVRRDPK